MAALRVIEIFDSLQGEGFWTGVPMTFVRLAGCNAPELGLDCVPWCDTADSWALDAGAELEPAEILDRTRFPRLCLTGGEPLLQTGGVTALVTAAHYRGIKVHLETNGTLAPPKAWAGPPPNAWGGLPPGAVREESPLPMGEALFDWAVVSPKGPDYLIEPEWEGLIDELKLIVDGTLEAATAERLAARHPEAIVSIQPVWDADRAGGGQAGAGQAGAGQGASAGASGDVAPGNLSYETAAIRLVMEHPYWRLSLQTHKYLGIR
jgi:7-carboxy-7-deazaguanine synthase